MIGFVGSMLVESLISKAPDPESTAKIPLNRTEIGLMMHRIWVEYDAVN